MSEDCLEMALPAEPSSETDDGKVAKKVLGSKHPCSAVIDASETLSLAERIRKDLKERQKTPLASIIQRATQAQVPRASSSDIIAKVVAEATRPKKSIVPTLRFPFKDYAERLRSVNGFFEEQIRKSVRSAFPFDAIWLERISSLESATFDPLAPSEGISATLLEMRRTTSLVATFSEEYSRQIEGISTGKRGGISSLLQYWKKSRAYKKDIKSLHRRTEELYKLLEKEFDSRRPKEPSISEVLERLKEIPKRQETKKKEEPEPQKGTEPQEETPPTPPPAPTPPPKPPRKPDDPDLSQEKQEKAAKIIGQFSQSLATIVVNVNIASLNVNVLPGATPDGKSMVQIADDAMTGIKCAAQNAIAQVVVKAGEERQTVSMLEQISADVNHIKGRLSKPPVVNLSAKSVNAVALKSAEKAAKTLKSAGLVRRKVPLFGNPDILTDEEKKWQDFRTIRMIRDMEHPEASRTSSGIEEAARRAEKRGWLIWYGSGRSAASAYCRLLRNTYDVTFHNETKYSNEQMEELKQRMD